MMTLEPSTSIIGWYNVGPLTYGPRNKGDKIASITPIYNGTLVNR